MRNNRGRLVRSVAAAVALALAGAVSAAGAKTPTFTTVGQTTTTTTTTVTTSASTTTTTATTTSPTSTPTPTTATSPAATTAQKTKAAANKKKQKAAKKKQPVIPTLTGWLGGDSAFPLRSLVLSVTPVGKLTPAQVTITENGKRVSGLTLKKVADGAVGDGGLMMVVDDSTQSPPGTLQAEMTAVRAVARTRPANELLGLVRFDMTQQTLLAPTNDAALIGNALAPLPLQGPGANPAGAVHAAVDQLAESKVADGTVVVVSDGIGVQGPPIKAALATALAHHFRIITVGLKDGGATKRSLAALSTASSGVFETATPTQLPQVLSRIQTELNDDYIARWKSTAPYASTVTVVAGASGLRGSVSASYRSPAAAPVAIHRKRRVRHAASSATTVASTLLSPYPSFADRSVAPPVATATSFWASPAAVPAVALGVALLVAFAVLLVFRRPSDRAARNRVGSFIPIATIEEYLSVQSDVPTPAPTTNRQQGKWWPTFVEAVEISRNPHSPRFLVRRAAVVALLLAVVLGIVVGSILVAFVPLIAWPFLLHWMVMRGAEKQRLRFRDTLPNYAQDIASAMRVGRSFSAAIGLVAQGADEPTKSEFERAATDESLGRPLEDTLENIAKRMESDAMGQIALIAGLHRRTGSNVAESLDRVAEGARDRADLRREMNALTSQAKMSSLVLTALPAVLLVGMTLLSHRYAAPLFDTTIGNVALGMGAVLVGIGWKVMSNITRVEV